MTLIKVQIKKLLKVTNGRACLLHLPHGSTVFVNGLISVIALSFVYLVIIWNLFVGMVISCSCYPWTTLKSRYLDHSLVFESLEEKNMSRDLMSLQQKVVSIFQQHFYARQQVLL